MKTDPKKNNLQKMYVHSDNPTDVLLKLSLQNPDVFYKTQNGEVIHNGKVTPKKDVQTMETTMTQHPRALNIIIGFYRFLDIVTLGKLRRKVFRKKKK